MELFTYALLATVLAMVVVQNLELLVGLAALQALLLGAGAAWLGWQDGDPALYFAAALTVSIKAVVIPLFLRYIIRRINVIHILDSAFTVKVTLLIAIVLTFVAHYATGALAQVGGIDSDALAAALTLVLIGVFLMVSRRVALTQVLGLLVMENGLFLAALATAKGLPLLVDVGVFFDVLVGALVMGLMIYRISATFEHIDTSELRRLQG
jgi:hydrogenase-4 membrane subunit HyfE